MRNNLLKNTGEVSFDIELDGRKINSGRDPPGQKSVYIPPGDTERETYRLTTFRNYPRNSPIDPRELASSGFYYVGYKDRVKCFSCGQSVDNWLATDNVASSGWHDNRCEFMNGIDERNVPILSFLRQRRPTSNQRHHSTSNHSNQSTPQQNSGKENLSATSHLTHSHQTVTKTDSSAASSDSSSSSTASSTRDSSPLSSFHTSTASTINSRPSVEENHSSRVQTQPDRVNDPNVSLHDMFPCLSPLNPHMRSSDVRRQTFIDHSSIWPAHRIRATPADIADAGMYYLGERDRVKCWYCNGGLQNWERDDSPWEEHAKWFPLCEFVLQQKGSQFVHDIVARHPGLRRPTLYNPSTSLSVREIAAIVNQPQNRFGGLLGGSAPNSIGVNSPTPIIVDPQREITERNRRIEEDMRSSENVTRARLLGFDDKNIKASLKRKYERDNTGFETFQELVENILSTLEEVSSEEEEIATSSSEAKSTTVTSSLRQMQRLEESKRCRVCREDDACVVLIPCGHLCCCVSCGHKIKKCPICKEMIRERVRSYIS